MRLALALVAALVVAAGPAVAGDIPAALTIGVGNVVASDLGVDVNFTVKNGTDSRVSVVFAICTALDQAGRPKGEARRNVHNVKPGELAYGQASFWHHEATAEDRFTCRIDEVSN